MPDFLLTVAVPTFDRAPLLAQTLASIADACRETTEPVEVLVVDNASADNTRDVVAGFAGAIPALRYECQHANVGGEANFFSCIDRARGRHVWVVGDDDVVERNAVVSILSALHGGAGAVVVNYSVYASDLQTVIKPRFFTEPRDRVRKNLDRLIESLAQMQDRTVPLRAGGPHRWRGRRLSQAGRIAWRCRSPTVSRQRAR